PTREQRSENLRRNPDPERPETRVQDVGAQNEEDGYGDEGGTPARQRRDSRPIQCAAPFQCSRKRGLVCVLQIAADGKPSRDARETHTVRFEELRDVVGRGISLDIGVEREDDILDSGAFVVRGRVLCYAVTRSRLTVVCGVDSLC